MIEAVKKCTKKKKIKLFCLEIKTFDQEKKQVTQ
jgi:hypothetical protein